MNRLVYIDCIRGLSMIFVVYAHLVVFGMSGMYKSNINEIVQTFRMPLFFFLSGFVSYKIGLFGTGKDVKERMIKKIRGQLIPTICVAAFFCFTHDVSIQECLLNTAKTGYWFTWVSFLIYSVWVIGCYILFTDLKKKIISVTLLGVVLGVFLLLIKQFGISIDAIARFFSFKFLYWYIIFFFVGIILKCHIKTFNNLVTNKYFLLVTFLLCFITPQIPIPGGEIFSPIRKIIVALPRIIVIYSIFYRYRDFWSGNNKISKILSMIGRHTLEIYFIHYFLLFRLEIIADYLASVQLSPCFHGSSSTIIPELIILFPLAIVLCLTSIYIRKIVDVFPIISEMCFGPINTKKK